MGDILISKRYAKAIYEVAKENNKIFEVFEALNMLLDTLDRDVDLKNFLTYPTIENKEKKELIKKIYSNLDEKSIEILDYLIEKDRILYIKDIYSEYNKIYYEENNKIIVMGTFPKELTDEQKNKLVKKLEKKSSKEVVIHYKIDKSLIGGGIIRIDDDIIDGSIKTQINKLKNIF